MVMFGLKVLTWHLLKLSVMKCFSMVISLGIIQLNFIMNLLEEMIQSMLQSLNGI